MAYSFRLFLACLLGLLLPQLAAAADVRNEMISKQTDKLRIEIQYPVIGQPRADADISAWAQQPARNFENDYAQEPIEEEMPYELRATYTISRPSDRAISIAWEVGTFTGGAHGNLDIITKTYDLHDGAPVDIHDLFKDLETALNHMSVCSYNSLSESLGDMRVEDMLRGGTTPDADNFSSLALIPSGVRIYFQPYQVAPWAAGPQTVDVSLEDLMEAEPRLDLWGRPARP